MVIERMIRFIMNVTSNVRTEGITKFLSVMEQ